MARRRDIDGDALGDPAARDWAVRDYRTHLLTVARRHPSTVNGYLTAVDDFYRRLGFGPAAARREDLPKAAPRALDKKTQLRWLRAAEHAPPRDRALALAGFYAGLRIGEIVALDLDDVRSSARKATWSSAKEKAAASARCRSTRGCAPASMLG